jgi:tryptophan synthase alpha chain
VLAPDLPPEEADDVEAACKTHGLAMNYFLAPTSTEARIRDVAQRTTGFLYLVSVTGITGARVALPPDLGDFVQRVRRHCDLPLAVGFGIGTGVQAAAVAAMVEGVIVGSALVKAAGSAEGVEAVRKLGAELAAGTHGV